MSPSNLEILGYEDTALGTLILRRRELLSDPGTIVTEIMLDHELLMSSLNTASERRLATAALALHAGAAPREVMVGGLGLGYTAHEVLRSEAVERVEVVELLPHVVAWLREGLFPLSAALAADARCEIVPDDVYARLAAPPERAYDLILIDVDHSPDDRLGESNAGFYSEPGLRAAARHLAPGGLLGVWSYAESSPFSAALRNVFERVDVEPVSFENELIGETETDWLFFAQQPRSAAG